MTRRLKVLKFVTLNASRVDELVDKDHAFVYQLENGGIFVLWDERTPPKFKMPQILVTALPFQFADIERVDGGVVIALSGYDEDPIRKTLIGEYMRPAPDYDDGADEDVAEVHISRSLGVTTVALVFRRLGNEPRVVTGRVFVNSNGDVDVVVKREVYNPINVSP